jgi:sugar phosphate isomerase/epimerase
LDYLCLNADLIAEVGATTAVLHFDSDADAVGVTDELCQFVDYCSQRGLTVAIENLSWGVTSDPARLLDIVAKSGSKITLDIGHAMIRRSLEAFREFVKLVGHLVVHVHLYGEEGSSRSHLPFSSREVAHFVFDVLRTDTVATWWTCEMDSLSLCCAQRDTLETWLQSSSLSPAHE